jgi:hypothetical protein
VEAFELDTSERHSRTFQRSPGAVWRALPDGVVILPPDADDPITVSGPGADVWTFLAQPHTTTSLATVLAERYSENATVIQADLESLLADLCAQGAVSYSTDRAIS